MDNTPKKTLMQAALDYAARGWHVFPCKEEGENAKKPYTKHGFKDASTDPATIRRWWKDHPNALIGCACGKSKLFVIDLDTKDGRDGITNFNRLGIDHTGALESTTPNGGLHIVFSGSGKTTTNEEFGIDTRGEKGYFILPPSIIVNCGAYVAMDDWKQAPAPVPAGLMEALESLRGKSASKPAPRLAPAPKTDDVEKARQALERLAPWRCDDYQPWVDVGMSLSELGTAGLYLWDSWSRRSQKYQEGVCAEKWESFKPGQGLTLGSLFHWAQEDDPRPSRVVVSAPPEPEAPPAPDDVDLMDENIINPNVTTEESFPIFTDMPPLPREAQLTEAEEAEALQAGKWVTEYVNWASEASPMTPPFFHQSYALAILSTSIARRVFVKHGKHVTYPNLYVLLVALSSLYAKTSGLELAEDLLEMAGLDQMLLPTGVTPQSLLTELTTRPPITFNDWSQEDKTAWQQERKFAAQRAWFMDEAAGLLDLFKQKNTADVLTIILKLYNCQPKLSGATVGRGRETARNTYLTICGPTTPAAMRTHLNNSELWGDGLFARFLFVTPDVPPVDVFFPDGLETPPSLAKHINTLTFTRLSMPKENALGSVEAPPAVEAIISPEAREKWKAYFFGIRQLIKRRAIPEKAYSLYSRMHMHAIKIAMLLAASDWATMAEGNPLIIRLPHWYRAQIMAEEYRASLHRMIDEASRPVNDDDQDLAEKIINRVKTSTRNSRRELTQDLHVKAGIHRQRFDMILDQLLKDGDLIEREVKKERGPGTMRLFPRNP